MNSLNLYLRHISWRFRLRDTIDNAQYWLWLLALLAFSIQGIGRIIPIPHLARWTLAPIIGYLLGVAIYNLFKPLPPLRIARRIDSELKLKERLSTALVLQELGNIFNPNLVQAQMQDALVSVRNIQDIRLLPFTWSRNSLLIATLFISLTIILALAPNPMDAILAQQQAITQTANEQADQIQNLVKEIEANQELSPEERQQLERWLTDLAETLRANPGDLENALSDLSKVEQAIRLKMDPSHNARQANLDSLASRLESLSDMQNDPNQSKLENAAAAIEKIASQIGSMDQDQRQALADALAQMAAQSALAGDASLSQSLSALSQAARSGDQSAASQASQAARQALETLQTQFADQAGLEQALAQLQSSRQALVQTGQSIAQANSGQPNPGQNPGQGSDQGQGQNAGQGNPSGGGGSTANTLPPATRQGRANRPRGSAPDAQASDLPGQVYAPWQRGPGNGEELFISGQDTGQGETQTSEGQNPLPGSSGPSLVPYYEVYANYLNAANQTMQQSYIPANLLDYVRAYFTQLEP
jgi:hypothetical protein